MLAWRSRKHYLGGLRRVRLHLDTKSFHCTLESGATFSASAGGIPILSARRHVSSSARLTPFVRAIAPDEIFAGFHDDAHCLRRLARHSRLRIWFSGQTAEN